MPEPLATKIPPQNFAISLAMTFYREEKQEPPAPSDDIVRLIQARTDAWNGWWQLYCEPDVWTNLAKKRAMCCARLEYQDAFFALAAALAKREDS